MSGIQQPNLFELAKYDAAQPAQPAAGSREAGSTVVFEGVAPERDAAPFCPTHKRPMQQRDEKLSSAEQRWCGRWWDCTSCTNSVLQPSAELLANHAAQQKPGLHGAAEQSASTAVVVVPAKPANDPMPPTLHEPRGPGLSAYWSAYQAAVFGARDLLQAQLDASVEVFGLGKQVGEPFDYVERMVSKTARGIRFALVAKAQKEFAPPLGTLKISTDEIEEACGPAWEDEGFDPDRIWAALEARYGGQAGVNASYEQAAEVFVKHFDLRRSPPVRRSNRLVLEARIYCSRNFSGDRRNLGVSSERSTEEVVKALATFATWAGDETCASALMPGGRCWTLTGHNVVSRKRLQISTHLSIVTFHEKLQYELYGELGLTKFQAFVCRFGAKALASRDN